MFLLYVFKTDFVLKFSSEDLPCTHDRLAKPYAAYAQVSGRITTSLRAHPMHGCEDMLL